MSLKDRLNQQTHTVVNKEATQAKIAKLNKPQKVQQNLSGFGNLETFFVDESLNSITIQGAKNVYMEKHGIFHKSTVSFSDDNELIDLIKKNAKDEVDGTKVIKFNLKEGINALATIPPLSDIPSIYIKCYNDSNAKIKTLQEDKLISKEIAMVLEALVSTKTNILITGNPKSLKTTILSSLAKLLPLNSRGVFVDFQNEVKIKTQGFVNYNLSNLENKKEENEILNSIVNSNPDRIFINDIGSEFYNEIVNFSSLGYRGFILNVCSKNSEDVINLFTQNILKENPYLDFESAKARVFEAFDIIIETKKDEYTARNISKIVELDQENRTIKDIFHLNNDLEFTSSGYIPKFYSLLKQGSISINSNIFDENYKHTYHQGLGDVTQNPCNELIRKMKENASKGTFETSAYNLNSEEIMKKAQEKFQELKRNAKLQEQIKEPNEPENIQNDNSEVNLNEQ